MFTPKPSPRLWSVCTINLPQSQLLPLFNDLPLEGALALPKAAAQASLPTAVQLPSLPAPPPPPPA